MFVFVRIGNYEESDEGGGESDEDLAEPSEEEDGAVGYEKLGGASDH